MLLEISNLKKTCRSQLQGQIEIAEFRKKNSDPL